jgi:hypothetical protein
VQSGPGHDCGRLTGKPEVGLLEATANSARWGDNSSLTPYGVSEDLSAVASGKANFRFEMFAGALALRLEGVVAKNAASPYVQGPQLTWHWQKIKSREYKRQGKVEFRQKRA